MQCSGALCKYAPHVDVGVRYMLCAVLYCTVPATCAAESSSNESHMMQKEEGRKITTDEMITADERTVRTYLRERTCLRSCTYCVTQYSIRIVSMREREVGEISML